MRGLRSVARALVSAALYPPAPELVDAARPRTAAPAGQTLGEATRAVFGGGASSVAAAALGAFVVGGRAAAAAAFAATVTLVAVRPAGVSVGGTDPWAAAAALPVALAAGLGARRMSQPTRGMQTDRR